MSMDKPKIDLLVDPTGDEPDEVMRAREFLAGGPMPGALSSPVAEALVSGLVARGEAGRMAALAAAPDKAVAKAARRGIHLLRARGMRAEVPPPEPKRFTEPAPPEPESVMTGVLRDGESIVWYVHPDPDEPVRLELFQGVLSEVAGLVKFEVYRATRRQWRDLEKAIEKESRLPVARVPSSWARWLLEEGYHRALELGRGAARDYAQLRHTLPEAKAPGEHPGLAAVPSEAVARQREAGQPERALDLAEARSWMPDEAVVRTVLTELTTIDESPILLEPRVREERVQEVLRRHAADAMRGPFRARLSRRLLDTAWFIVQRALSSPSSSRDVVADAALCVYASEVVASEEAPGEDNPVVRKLFARIASRPAEAPAEEPSQGGGVSITP